MVNFDVITPEYPGGAVHSNVISIPINKYEQVIYINTFNMTFEVYWLTAYGRYIIKKYGLTVKSNSSINLIDLTPDVYGNVGEVVAYIEDDECHICVKGIDQYAYVGVKIVHCNHKNYIEIKKLDPFKDISEKTKILPTSKKMVPRTVSETYISDNSIFKEMEHTTVNTYLKIFEVSNISNYTGGCFTLEISDTTNDNEEAMLELVHIKYRISNDIPKAQISRISGNSTKKLIPEILVTYDTSNNTFLGYINHSYSGVKSLITLLSYRKGDSIINLITNEEAKDNYEGDLLANTIDENAVSSISDVLTGNWKEDDTFKCRRYKINNLTRISFYLTTDSPTTDIFNITIHSPFRLPVTYITDDGNYVCGAISVDWSGDKPTLKNMPTNTVAVMGIIEYIS